MSRRDPETIDERLARLREGTRALAPAEGLAERLARAARPRGGRRGLAGVVLPFGRGALVAAALAATAALALVVHSEAAVDEAVTRDEAGALWEP